MLASWLVPLPPAELSSHAEMHYAVKAAFTLFSPCSQPRRFLNSPIHCPIDITSVTPCNPALYLCTPCPLLAADPLGDLAKPFFPLLEDMHTKHSWNAVSHVWDRPHCRLCASHSAARARANCGANDVVPPPRNSSCRAGMTSVAL